MKIYGRYLFNGTYLRLTIVFSLLFTLLSCISPESAEAAVTPDQDAKRFSKVDQVFTQWNKPTTLGCAIAIIKDGKILYSQGDGLTNLDYDIPITPETVAEVK